MIDKFLRISSIVVSIILTFSLLLESFASISGQSTPPNEGDWTIKDSEIVSHKSLTLNDNIIIKSGGELQLNYADLKFNSNKDFEYKIHVEDGGELEMRYSSINLNSDYTIVIIVEPEGNLKIYNSTIDEFSTIETTIEIEIFSLSEILIIMIITMVIIVVLLAIGHRFNQEMLQQLKSKVGRVVKPVHPDNSTGTIRIDSRIRSAKSKGDKTIEADESVMVVDIEGRILIVERLVDIVNKKDDGGLDI